MSNLLSFYHGNIVNVGGYHYTLICEGLIACKTRDVSSMPEKACKLGLLEPRIFIRVRGV